jgi:hypothetical protein
MSNRFSVPSTEKWESEQEKVGGLGDGHGSAGRFDEAAAFY